MKIVNEIIKYIKNIFKIRDKKTFIKQNAPYLVFFYLGNIFSGHVNKYSGGDLFDRIFQGLIDIQQMSFLPKFDIINILTGLIFALVIKLIVFTKGKNAKKFRQGKEYGSARWGNSKDIEPYVDEKFENNILLTNTERLTMNSRPSNLKNAIDLMFEVL